MQNADIAALRIEYASRHLRRADLRADPLDQFAAWLEEAVAAQIKDPNAMSLATVDAAGQPSARMVLLKGIARGGLMFFTNYESRKARELAENGRVAANFFWAELERQVCIEGAVERATREEAEAYFQSRPRGSRLGAWASHQSEAVPNREFLEEKLRKATAEFEGRDIPTPPFWGGYRIVPASVEFWQGGKNRLHDRFIYRRSGSAWKIERLSP